MSNKSDSVEAWLQELGQPSADRDYRPGHDRVHALLGRLQLKRPALRVRIAGTNGKGSTAQMLAAALTACGMRVGLYTSPHIHRFNERIRIQGQAVEDSELLSHLKQLMPVALACGASYFEMATALALACFSEAKVDVEILEAGVGARLDATTAVPADMALITSIGLDHQDWLGNTLQEIATEKACAMDGCRNVISSAQVPEVASALAAHRADIAFAGSDTSLPPLAVYGDFQKINAGLAHAAVLQLQGNSPINIDTKAVVQAIAETRLAGRMQLFRLDDCRIWLDVAHNRHAIEAVARSCAAMNEYFEAIFVFTREDRSLDDALPLLSPLCRRLITRNADPNIETALTREMGSTPSGSFLILGSFITIAAAENWLRQVSRTQ
ncbi:MAG: Mur ligase family protein [Mariprofundaceae bacterium]